MPLTAFVFCSASKRRFPVTFNDSIRADELKVLIQADPSGKAIGFAVVTWGIFLADNEGKKSGDELRDDHTFSANTNVWVEADSVVGAFPHKLAPIFAFSRLNS